MKSFKLIKLNKKIKTGKLFRNIVISIFGIVFIAIILSVLPIPGMYKLYTVQSGSMEPNIKTGSLAVVLPADTYSTGDVITFNDSANNKKTTTHRIESITESTFQTKGDANENIDTAPVLKTAVIGKMLFHIPYIGYPIGYAKTLPGLIILIVIPATIIIWEESKKLKKEWLKIQKKKKKTSVKTEQVNITKIIILILCVLGISTVATNSYFIDVENSKNNTMISGAWIDETDCLVINEVYYDVDEEHGLDGEDMNGPDQNGPQNNNPDEWVEIYNNCDFNISLKNWTLTDNEAIFLIRANKYVPANGYALLSKSANTWTQYWGFTNLGNLENIQIIELGEGGPPIYQIYDNAGDFIILKNKTFEIVDQMSYINNTYLWNPTVPGVAEGNSLSRDPVGYDTDQPSDFVENCEPSPGEPNVTLCPAN
ncbi:MAG: signal peptidase I [Candidatus Kerfeldbacteria bacterium]